MNIASSIHYALSRQTQSVWRTFSNSMELHISQHGNCMHQILFQKDHVPGPLLGRDFLWSLKRPLNPCILGSGWLLTHSLLEILPKNAF